MRNEAIGKLNIIAVLAALLIYSAPMLAQDELHLQGYKAYKSKNYSEAIRIFRDVVEEYPDWHFGHHYLAKSYQASKQYDKAIKSFRTALDYAQNPDEILGNHYGLASSYYAKKDYSRVIQHIVSSKRQKKAKSYSKVLDSLLTMEGFSNYHLNKHKQAIAAFKPLMDSGKANTNILKTVAKSYQALGQDGNAVTIVAQVVRKDPKDITAQKILVKSYVNGKKWKEAVDSAAFALRYFDRDWELFYLKGLAESKRGKTDSAISSLKRSVAIRPQDKVRKLLGDQYVIKEQWLEATRQFDAVQKGYAGDSNFYVTFAFAWFKYVPNDTEKYKGKRAQEREYTRALNNAATLLNNAKTLKGADQAKIAGIMAGIDNKKERLEKGQSVIIKWRVWIDPETGEIKRERVNDGDSG